MNLTVDNILDAAKECLPSREVEFRRISVFVSGEVMREQTRFPKSKKRRIRKKWTKRSSNFTPITDRVYVANPPPIGWEDPRSFVMCHPIIEKKIRDMLRSEQDRLLGRFFVL